jgi:hypothetical protein
MNGATQHTEYDANADLEPVLIFSVNTLSSAQDELDEVRALLFALTGRNSIKVKQVQGRYNGTDEFAYVVSAKDRTVVSAVKIIADTHNQESILLLTDNKAMKVRMAYLLYREDAYKSLNYIGDWIPVTMSEAVRLAGYTFDPFTGQHFAIREAA